MPNTQMAVLGRDTTGACLSVRLADGIQGWVARYLTNFIGVASILATPPLAPPATAPAVQAA
jgi:hypothetical protein